MTTEQTPERSARAAVLRFSARLLGYNPDDADNLHELDVLLDRLCAERYAAGKVAGLKEMGCTQIPWCWSAFRIEERKGGQGDLCYRCRRLEKAEAEYEAAVAVLGEDNDD